MEPEELNQRGLEFFIGCSWAGFVGGWAAHATWVGDWPALAIAGLVAVVYLIYRQHRINRSFDIGE